MTQLIRDWKIHLNVCTSSNSTKSILVTKRPTTTAPKIIGMKKFVDRDECCAFVVACCTYGTVQQLALTLRELAIKFIGQSSTRRQQRGFVVQCFVGRKNIRHRRPFERFDSLNDSYKRTTFFTRLDLIIPSLPTHIPHFLWNHSQRYVYSASTQVTTYRSGLMGVASHTQRHCQKLWP